jgi:hypothetical protein
VVTPKETIDGRVASICLQRKLVVAENSGHYIPFDCADVVIDAIRQMVEAARTGTPLQ